MWFAFGFVTLAGAGIYSGYRRYAADWAATPGPGYSYRIDRNHKSEKIFRARLALPTRAAVDFECKRESAVDRFFKRVGLAAEQQIGSASFDDTVYLVSDDPRVRELLRAAPELADDVAFLFANEGYSGFRLTRLTCRAGRVWLDFKAEGEQLDAFGLFDWALPSLKRICAALPDPLLRGERPRDPMFLRSVLVLALSSGLAIHGGIQLFRMYLTTTPFTADTAQLRWLAVLAGLVVLGLLVALAFSLLGRSSRLHLVLLELLLVGSFGAITTCLAAIRDFNIEFDSSVATVRPAQVHSRSTHRSRRGGRSYYLTVEDWNGGGERRIRVSSGLYESATPGHTVGIRQHPGRLGIRWVDGIDYGVATER